MSDEIQQVHEGIPFSSNGWEEEDYPGGGLGSVGMAMLNWVTTGTDEIPPYWSWAREAFLRQFVYRSGAIKTALLTFVNKAVTVPSGIQAKNPSIPRRVRQAEDIQKNFRRYSGSMSSSPMKGWKAFSKAFWFDYLSMDNGAFALVLGEGPADGPIIGPPFGLLHLDSFRCIRTKSMEYPVKYRHEDGKEYKLHHTRVIEMANLPSPDVNLNGVGLCATSCCIEAAQEIMDMYRYSAEKFGSRPPRQIVYIKRGGTYAMLEKAVNLWSFKLDQRNQTHFGGTLLMAPQNARAELELGITSLNSEPENFNRRDVTTIDKSEIAAAFGLDLRDMSYLLGAPSRTGDAEVQDRKGRGKGVGEALETFSERFDEICLNNELFSIRFDNLDDEQDEQRANIRDRRSQARERDLRSGLTTVRVEREKMWENGEIDQEQFDEMELLDGRLPSGLDVLLLFQSQDGDFQEWLDLGVPDPTNVRENDPAQMIDLIHERIISLSESVHAETRSEKLHKARQALAALEKLKAEYQAPEDVGALDEQSVLEAEDEGQEAQPAEEEVAEEPSATEEKKSLKQVEVQEDEIDAILRDYQERFRRLAQQASEDEIPRRRFEELISDLISLFLLSLFRRGSRTTYTEMTRDEINSLQNSISDNLDAVRSITDDIYAGRYAGNEAMLARRLETWANNAAGVYYLGVMHRRDDPFLRWEYGPTEHCSDCLRLHGQVHRGSAWRASGWFPRAFHLECTGLHCQCRMFETEGPEVGTF